MDGGSAALLAPLDGLGPGLGLWLFFGATALVMGALLTIRGWRWATMGTVERQVPVHALGGAWSGLGLGLGLGLGRGSVWLAHAPLRVGPLAQAYFTADAVHCGHWTVVMQRDRVRVRELLSPCSLVPLPCVELSDGRQRIVLWRDAATMRFLSRWAPQGSSLWR